MSSNRAVGAVHKRLQLFIDRLPILTLIFLSAAILKHAWLGTLSRFIHPRYTLFTVFFVSLALTASIFVILQKRRSNGGGPAVFGTFIISIITLIAPARALSSFVASNRFSSSTLIQVKEEPTTYQRFSRDLTQFSLSELVSLFQTPNSADSSLGATVRVQGFIFEDRALLIGRFKVSCCAIDATPIGVRIMQGDLASSLIVGSWYEIEGVIARDDTGFLVDPKTVTIIQSPEQPYVF